MAAWRAGEPLYLETSDIEAQAVEQEASRHVDDGLAGSIAEWLDNPNADDFLPETDRRPLERVCARQIWFECLRGRETEFTRTKADQMSRAMQRVEGWVKHPRTFHVPGYGRQKGWLKSVRSEW